jgi:hypothetical protein
MVDALLKLDNEEKSKIHVVFPMTYGASPEYLKEIKAIIQKSNLSYTILETYLEAKEVAAIRKTADIVLNIQDTDAFAGSLKGHLYCNNVCIFGEWLDYSICEDNGVYYIKSSKEGITDNLRKVILNYPKYKRLCSGNNIIIKSPFSWEATMSKQISVYGE